MTTHNNYNHNYSRNGLSNNNSGVYQPSSPLEAGYNYKPQFKPNKNPAWYVGFDRDGRPNDLEIHSPIAQWGVHPGMLVNAIKRLGVGKVRASIQYVAGMGNYRFGVHGDMNDQRGRYLKRVLDNGGVFDYDRNQDYRNEGDFR